MDVSSLTSTISSLKAQNSSLENSLNAMKQTNKQTIDYQSEQFTSVQHRWENEKEEVLKSSQELMKLKNDILELKKELQMMSDSKNDATTKCENEQRANEELKKQINMLNIMIESNNKNVDNKNEKEKEKHAIEAMQKFENEKLMLQEKVNQLNTKLIEHANNNKEVELNNKVHHLENELTCLNQKFINENKENTESNKKLQSKLTELQEEINKKKYLKIMK